MTGRDLIVYILQNNLEDEPVFKDGKFIGFASIDEVAVKFGVGIETVKTWIRIHAMNGVEVDGTVYILPDSRWNIDYGRKE